MRNFKYCYSSEIIVGWTCSDEETLNVYRILMVKRLQE
jgi:hypothetical protein